MIRLPADDVRQGADSIAKTARAMLVGYAGLLPAATAAALAGLSG